MNQDRGLNMERKKSIKIDGDKRIVKTMNIISINEYKISISTLIKQSWAKYVIQHIFNQLRCNIP